MRRILGIMALLVCIVLPACKASTGGSGSTVFESPVEKVEHLLNQGKIKEASDVVVDNESYFAGAFGDPEVKVILDRLAGALDYKYSPAAQAIADKVVKVQWPVPRSGWSAVKREIAPLRRDLDQLSQIAVFKYPRYRPEIYTQAVTNLEAVEERIRQDAAGAFAKYPLQSGQDFFAEYPVTLDEASFLEQNKAVWSKALSGSPSQVESFLATYGGKLPASARNQMAEQYFKSLCPKGKNADLKDILAAYRKCKEAGIELDQIPGIKIAFLQVTSPDLIKDKSLDFGVNIKLDMPFDASKASMRKAFSHDAVKDADILILINMAVSKAKRVVEKNETIHSTYVASYEKEENPEYTIIKAEMEAASQQMMIAKNKETTSWMVSAIAHLSEEAKKEDAIEEAGKMLNVAKEKLRNTPKYITVPNYQPYPVTKAHMDIYKFATVNYYIVDKRKKVFFRDTFDISDKSFFTVCYAMEDSDPNRDKFLQTSVLEEDVVRFEMEPVPVNLSDLIEQFSSRKSAWKKYASMGDVHRSFTTDRSTAQLKHKDWDFGYDKHSDKRFDSVVVVRNTGKGMGTGFYVTDDMVITNYHVVEESNYVQLKLYDERETMGRVIARDAQLDLAIIQADIRMKPVCFYNKRTLPIGKTLEVIGHPDGYEFSITRGIISTIRKTPPINFRGSNTEVLYIQTDASTNGGNSGGPVFFGDYVVGVHDWGRKLTRSGMSAQGLNFSIHYSEVFKFFDHHGIKVCKGGK